MGGQSFIVYGDSFANFQRFDAGISENCGFEVVSISRPGFSSQKLLQDLRRGHHVRSTIAESGNVAGALVIAGVNDIILRRGAASFSRSMSGLQRELLKLVPRLFVLEIVPFDETADLSKLPGKIKHKVFEALWDRKPHRVERYRSALQLEDRASLVSVADWMPSFDGSRFKDRIHLTDTEFSGLAQHVGAQIAGKFGVHGAAINSLAS